MSAAVRLQGHAAAFGLGIGKVFVAANDLQSDLRRRLVEDEVCAELERFTRAWQQSKKETLRAQADLKRVHGVACAEVLEPHVLMHDDPVVHERVVSRIRDDKQSAEWALEATLAEFEQELLKAASDYLRERAADIVQLGAQVVRHLRGEAALVQPEEPSLIVAHDLGPADAVQLLQAGALGLVTATGSPTGHTAILARALGVPAVVGVGRFPAGVRVGAQAIVDGTRGEVIVSPTPAQLEEAHRRADRIAALQLELNEEQTGPTTTADGTPAHVLANIELPSETDTVLQTGAEGVGLYRTEFVCLEAGRIPSEDEQFVVYADLVRRLQGRPITFRTFDLRGDKLPQALRPLQGRVGDPASEAILGSQLCALLRASQEGPLRIMFPMIADDADAARSTALAHRCADRLGLAELPELGLMLEDAAAIERLTRLARHCDFFALGTNDLSHQVLGMDRFASKSVVADHLDPKVLHAIAAAIDGASAQGLAISVCGALAHDRVGIPVLLGLGCRRFSVPAPMLPWVRATIARCDLGVAEEVAKNALSLSSSDETRALVDARFGGVLLPLGVS